jgi:hypothetical protein
MAYREKIAWLSLFAMAVTFGPYFASSAGASRLNGHGPNLRQLELYAVAAVLQMLILGGGRLWLRRQAGGEAGAAPDERDRAIDYRSIRFAYAALIAGMVLVGCVMPFQSSGWSIINAALFMIVAAEVVHYGVVVFSYRRQA